MRAAIIDCGSNTFHLLIAEYYPENHSFQALYKQRDYVKLGIAGGDIIPSESYDNAIKAMASYAQHISAYQVSTIRAIGTATLRRASNAKALLTEIQQRFSIEVEIIDGNQEAAWIYQGIEWLTSNPSTHNALIMDIGGGSTEFILTQNRSVVFQDSIPLGLGVLKTKYYEKQPLTQVAYQQITELLNNATEELRNQMGIYPPNCLIGASGSFEVLAMPDESDQSLIALEQEQQHAFMLQTLFLPLDQIRKISRIPAERHDLIVVAFCWMIWAFRLRKWQHIYYSPYAMKEGILSELFKFLD